MNDDIFDAPLYVEPPPAELMLMVHQGPRTTLMDLVEFLVGLGAIVLVVMVVLVIL